MRNIRVAPIPFVWEAWVQSEYVAKEEGKHYPCLIYEALSTEGRALSFNILFECGAAYNNVPIQAFSKRHPVEDPENHQPWGCLSDALTIHRTPIFDGAKPLLSPAYAWSRNPAYRMTVTWLEGPYVEDPAQDKFGHVFEDEDGNILCLPNNEILDWRISWYQRANAQLPPLKRNTEIWRLP